MTREDIRKLMGGYATGTLTGAERKLLFDAALDDQDLFDELAGEQALKELLDQPGAKQRLVAALTPREKAWWTRPLPWVVAMSTVAAGIVTVVLFLRPLAPRQIATLNKADLNQADLQKTDLNKTGDRVAQPLPQSEPSLQKDSTGFQQGVPRSVRQKDAAPPREGSSESNPSPQRDVPGIASGRIAPREEARPADAISAAAADRGAVNGAAVPGGKSTVAAEPQIARRETGGAAAPAARAPSLERTQEFAVRAGVSPPAASPPPPAPTALAQPRAAPLAESRAKASPPMQAMGQVDKQESAAAPPASQTLGAAVVVQANQLKPARFAFDYAFQPDGRLEIKTAAAGYLRIEAALPGTRRTVFPANGNGLVATGSSTQVIVPGGATNLTILFTARPPSAAGSGGGGVVNGGMGGLAGGRTAPAGTVEDPNPSADSRLAVTVQVPPRR